MRKNVGKLIIVTAILVFNISVVSIATSPLTTSLSSSALLAEFPSDKPLVYVDPEVTESEVGVEFTVSVKVFNLTDATYTDDRGNVWLLGNLYGIDISFSWNATIIEYVTHLVKVPVDSYSDGVLYDPTQIFKDDLNSDAGTYRLLVTSQYPAIPFNNPGQSNIIFEMTFRAKRKGGTDLVLSNTALAGQRPGDRVRHDKRNGAFHTPGVPVAQFTFWPTDGYAAVDKPVKFDASSSSDSDGYVTQYIWDFGDTYHQSLSEPIVNHTYSTKGTFKATLIVIDNDGISSAPVSRTVNVVEKRDITLKSLWLSADLLTSGRVLGINVTVGNIGGARENSTISAYYNSTSIGGWMLIESVNMIDLLSLSDRLVSFNWNTSGVPSEAHYFILVNATSVPHEAGISDNTIRSLTSVWVTTEVLHDVALTLSSVATGSFGAPFILGENVTISFKVEARATSSETCNVTLRVTAQNGTDLLPIREWKNQFIEEGGSKNFQTHTTALPAVYCNITLEVDIAETDINPNNNFASLVVRVVKPPVLEIAPLPQTIYEGDTISFNATSSRHQDPEGQISRYTWEVRDPDAATFEPLNTGVVVTYVFDTTGSWTVRLRVEDNFGLSFDPYQERAGTSSYRKELTIDVKERPSEGGFQLPFDPLYLIIGVIVIAVIAVLVFMRVRKPKPSE